jgi:hypothetical protein
MTKPDHLTDDLLIRAIDDELAGSEIAVVESHLSRCEECRQKLQALRSLSARVETAVMNVVPEQLPEHRESLVRALESREHGAASQRHTGIRRFGWGMAIAASLALAVFFGTQWTHRTEINMSAGVRDAQATSAIEVDGETFIALPYSNPDLPMGAPHIVQMQVPVSSLADAGIVFEPISNRVAAPDRSVLADVLLGIDGQPLGVHVLE